MGTERQLVGFRIWNKKQDAILLYIQRRSSTWTLPTIEGECDKDKLLLFMEQFTNTELSSAVCIVNVENKVLIRKVENTKSSDIIHRFTIYDVVLQPTNEIGLDPHNLDYPECMKAAHFMSSLSVKGLTYKTPILSHLVTYMNENEDED